MFEKLKEANVREGQVWESDLPDRVSISLIKWAEYTSDYLKSIELLTSSRLAATDGNLLNDLNYVKLKGEAIGERQRDELIISRCGRPFTSRNGSRNCVANVSSS